MNILVTGAGKNGFLGKHVKAAFDKEKLINATFGTHGIEINYIGSEYDLTDSTQAYEAMQDNNADTIVHMAALCGGILANKNSPADFLVQNTKMNICIYDAALKCSLRNKRRMFIYSLGSVCSYPIDCPVPFSEDSLFNGFPEHTNARKTALASSPQNRKSDCRFKDARCRGCIRCLSWLPDGWT